MTAIHTSIRAGRHVATSLLLGSAVVLSGCQTDADIASAKIVGYNGKVTISKYNPLINEVFERELLKASKNSGLDVVTEGELTTANQPFSDHPPEIGMVVNLRDNIVLEDGAYVELALEGGGGGSCVVSGPGKISGGGAGDVCVERILQEKRIEQERKERELASNGSPSNTGNTQGPAAPQPPTPPEPPAPDEPDVDEPDLDDA